MLSPDPAGKKTPGRVCGDRFFWLCLYFPAATTATTMRLLPLFLSIRGAMFLEPQVLQRYIPLHFALQRYRGFDGTFVGLAESVVTALVEPMFDKN
jgi:hypothetical protein